MAAIASYSQSCRVRHSNAPSPRAVIVLRAGRLTGCRPGDPGEAGLRRLWRSERAPSWQGREECEHASSGAAGIAHHSLRRPSCNNELAGAVHSIATATTAHHGVHHGGVLPKIWAEISAQFMQQHAAAGRNSALMR